MDEVNEMWAGLGYYRRARYLLEGAKYVMQECGGEFPSTTQELQKIPGPFAPATLCTCAPPHTFVPAVTGMLCLFETRIKQVWEHILAQPWPALPVVSVWRWWTLMSCAFWPGCGAWTGT